MIFRYLIFHLFFLVFFFLALTGQGEEKEEEKNEDSEKIMMKKRKTEQVNIDERSRMAEPPPPLRPYQQRIVAEAQDASTIVVLPTGSGKTAIAAVVMFRALMRARATCYTVIKPIAVFLVPTCLLVEQQCQALRYWTNGLVVVPFMGGMVLPEIFTFDILVSTPKAFLTKLKARDTSLAFDNICLLAFDEVHHVLKKHDYRTIALLLEEYNIRKASSFASADNNNNNSNKNPTASNVQVLGLSASLTYAVTAVKVNLALQQLCQELQVTKMETADVEELVRDGYRGNCGEPSLGK